jgi:hypothetical protein
LENEKEEEIEALRTSSIWEHLTPVTSNSSRWPHVKSYTDSAKKKAGISNTCNSGTKPDLTMLALAV